LGPILKKGYIPKPEVIYTQNQRKRGIYRNQRKRVLPKTRGAYIPKPEGNKFAPSNKDITKTRGCIFI